MNKTAIKNFAIWARVTLLEAVKQKAYEYEITETGENDPNAQIVSGRPLTVQEKQQRRELIAQIESKKFDHVMEEAAYTWFNRFIALRYMEVNGYLPSRVRVFTNEMGEFKPEILKEAMTVDLPGLEREKILELLEKQDNEALYKMLLIAQCNALSDSLPRMFEKIANWTELLFPGNLLKADSVPGRMVADIPEEDWTDQVQIIGWLYQYYNTELKDDTFAQLKKNVKISKERIPAATQLFTPDWIVRYMVENSLGRIYISEQCSADNEQERIAQEKAIAEKMGWKYYLPEAEQSMEVRSQLNSLTTDHYSLTTLKLIDPCMGSGHILVYAFEVLMQIYLESGYNQRDAAQSILEHNLYGLDIDDRAAQLAYFAVMMKARSYDRRLFNRNIQPKVYAIRESNGVSPQVVDYFCNGDGNLKTNLTRVMEQMRDAKEYGSILNVTGVDFAALYARFDQIREDIDLMRGAALEQLLPVVRCAQLLAQKYDVVVTNPPYMGGSGMSAKLSEYVKKNYPDSKSDLFSCFIERGNKMVVRNGYNCMVTMQSWMFLSSFEKMREKILHSTTITNLMHMENMVMGIAFGTAVSVFRNGYLENYKGTYNHIKLQDIENGIPKEFPVLENRFAQVSTSNFSKIPGSPVAYWVSEAVINSFKSTKIGDISYPKQGLSSADNNRFLRYWFEVITDNIGYSCVSNQASKQCGAKWFPFNKGGEYRKWYGNLDYLINWQNDGFELRNFPNAAIRNAEYYFQPHITWSKVTSGTVAFRYRQAGSIFSDAGCAALFEDSIIWYALALLNTTYAQKIFDLINPTLNYTQSTIASLPIVINNKSLVEEMAKGNILLSREDWDSYETSWDFKRNPLV